jgi:hypothetical protein
VYKLTIIFAENVSDPFRERQYKSPTPSANPAVMSKGKEASAASPYPRAAAPGSYPTGVSPPAYYPPGAATAAAPAVGPPPGAAPPAYPGAPAAYQYPGGYPAAGAVYPGGGYAYPVGAVPMGGYYPAAQVAVVAPAMPPGSTVYAGNVFDSSARFDGHAQVRIPPPPPGVMPNAAQLAQMQGANVVAGQRPPDLWGGGSNTDYTMF